MSNKSDFFFQDFKNTFIKNYVGTIKRGILELYDKEEYKNGFRISYIPLDEIIKQMMLSEQVWVDNGTEVLPITLNTSSLQFKKSVNDKLINYTVDFEYAFNKINDIR